MSKILTSSQRDAARRGAQPTFMSPMLARLTRKRFSDDGWIYERKLDGERCLAVVKGGTVSLFSRNRRNLSPVYPEIVDQLDEDGATGYIVDGEIVAFSGNRTSFSRLQQRMGIEDPDEARSSPVAVYYYVFDVMFADGHDLCGLPLAERKRVLKKLLAFSNRVRWTPYRRGDGEAYYHEACRKGWEGVIAKRLDASYRHSRSSDWLKFKCVNQQELVIGGYTDPEGSRIGFGALLVGYYEKGELRYAGKVGTGYDEETLRSLTEKLTRHERKSCPFANSDEIKERRPHWVSPKLVGQFGFTEWTGDGKLRHPRFLGLRQDKPPKQVRREQSKG
ncbi:ATP-dependent DNA ligase [candidate division GN15 bacterium]|nr:ATP-dependent DNA ligase [candidate division GN15 bacterium]